MNEHESRQSDAWIQPFGSAFLGIDRAGVVQRGSGTVPITPGHSLIAAQMVGQTWQAVIALEAAEPARQGLCDLWQATAGGYVAPRYWPDSVPFSPGITARLRAVNDDSIAFTIHLASETGCTLDSAIGSYPLEALQRAVRLGRHVQRGTDGTLTDLQVKDIDSIVTHLERAWQFLDDLQAEVLTPTVAAPVPRSVADLLAFSGRSFSHHRIITHRLSIQNHLSAETVYCHAAIHDSVKAIIDALLTIIAAESAITLSDRVNDQDRAVEVGIHFRSSEPNYLVRDRVEPLALSDPARFEPMPPMLRLVSSAHSRLAPVRGRVWADACSDALNAACVYLRIPRWQSPS